MATEVQDATLPGEDQPVMYEELAALEKEFDDVDVEILRKQTVLLRPLYAKRQLLIARIPHFWALVLEQAPLDIDSYIQPSDSQVLGAALTNVAVERFEVAGGPASRPAGAAAAKPSANGNAVAPSAADGDPRSLLIRLEFAPNEWFEDDVLEKRFWYRRGRDGWAGLVSEPVGIRWKVGRDLTEGLGVAAVRLWEAERRVRGLGAEGEGKGMGKEGRKALKEYKELLKKLESSTPGAQSFFAWFAFRGRDVGVEESAVAKREEKERRARAKEGKDLDGKKGEIGAEEDEDLEEEDDNENEYEVFPLGDELAISIAEDLWPGAIKYFTQAQEQDILSEADFEDDPSDNNDDDGGDDDGDGLIPNLRGLVSPRGQGLPKDANDDDEEEEEEEEEEERGRPRKRART